jgi:hypothetical protein
MNIVVSRRIVDWGDANKISNMEQSSIHYYQKSKDMMNVKDFKRRYPNGEPTSTWTPIRRNNRLAGKLIGINRIYFSNHPDSSLRNIVVEEMY